MEKTWNSSTTYIFVVEEYRCRTGLHPVQTFHQLKMHLEIQKKPQDRGAVRILTIRQEWENMSLTNIQQLVSSLHRCLQTVETLQLWDTLLASISELLNLFIYFPSKWHIFCSNNSYLLCSVNKIQVCEIWKWLHFYVHFTKHPESFLTRDVLCNGR